MSTNVEIVHSWYESPDRESLAPEAEWLITEGSLDMLRTEYVEAGVLKASYTQRTRP